MKKLVTILLAAMLLLGTLCTSALAASEGAWGDYMAYMLSTTAEH